MKLEDCKKKGPVTKEFIEKCLASGKGGSQDVVERLVGMVLNGKKSFESGAPPPPKAKKEAAKPSEEEKKKTSSN